jgi:hypothetical protein
MAFLLNNLQSVVTDSVGGNSNSVIAIPNVTMVEPQAALVLSQRQPGGSAWRDPMNIVAPTNTTPLSVIGGEIGVAAARMGYTKGGGFIVSFASNGTTNAQVPLTNTQTNTNSFAGDTTFSTANVIIMQNMNNLDGVSVSGGSMYVNGSFTNGAVLAMNTNGTMVLTGNGGTTVIFSPNGIAIAAATAVMAVTPVNGGIFACAVYGS